MGVVCGAKKFVDDMAATRAPNSGTNPNGVGTCPGGKDTQEATSLPFAAFQLVMAALFILSGFAVKRMRRLSELRAQQRHERLGRVEVGFGMESGSTRLVI